MKQKNKAALIIGLTSIITVISALVLAFSASLGLITITLLTLFSFILSLSAIYLMIIKRVEKLNEKVGMLHTRNSLSSRIYLKGNDEINEIADNINLILDHVENANKQLAEKTNEISQSLQQSNASNEHLKQEISAKNRSEKMVIDYDYLMHLGKNDELTALPNMVQFNEILNKSLTHAQRRKQHLAILLVNMDLFKLVHETFGQANSDLILKEISKRLQNALRKEDILAKLDGDEFIILLNDIGNPKFASMVAKKILTNCSQLLKVDTHEFTVTASIGISIYPTDGTSMEEIIENADRALFKAKQAGGNTYQFHTEEIQIEAMEYLQLESALRNAIHNNELALHYQPKFKINTGNITAVEGLMRWEHPTLGIISPAKFIKLAEETGLIMQIGEWALHEACQRIKYWQNEGFEHITVALKLSDKQFNHPDIVKILKNVFASYDINPKYIELEITEKAVMENVETASTVLNRIKETGVQISIDHFGTGYTVISYLKKFPLSSIKIDQSYIKGIPNNPDDITITSALIALAHNLGLQVVAEGVESAEQVKFLSAEKCDMIQGYFLGHPVSAQKIVLQFKKLQDEVMS